MERKCRLKIIFYLLVCIFILAIIISCSSTSTLLMQAGDATMHGESEQAEVLYRRAISRSYSPEERLRSHND